MSARHLVIGLDGADVDVIDGLGEAALPALVALRRRGAWARLESVTPPATLPNWTTFLTGVDPGRHGVFDFTLREGYRVAFTAGTVRAAPTIAARLDAMGRRCACVGFPGTWPPERLAHGVFVSGWDSPVAFEADRSFVHPPSLHAELRARFGPLRFDDVDELAAEREGWHLRLPGRLAERIAHKTEVARWLLDRDAWDLFAFYFGESDTAAHHLWAFHDPASPRHRPGAPDALRTVYRALDRAVAELVAAAGEGTELTIVSDHGSGGAGTTVLYLNRLLERLGFAALADRGGRALAVVKDRALGALPPRARQAAFTLAGRALPGLVESRARFGGLDFARTRAFSDELNYFPAIHFNVRGREPEGIVAPADVPALTEALRAALGAVRDPFTGAPVFRRVLSRDELYDGPHVARAPDLVLELHLDRGYSYNLMPSGGAPAGTGPWRRLAPEEHLGKKGRSLPGSHRPRGLLVAAGPRVRPVGEVRARMADATATLLARMGVAPAPEMAGRVLREAVARGGDAPLASAPQPALAEGAPAQLEARLRALGYL
ncbi:MAG: alkaline phosphatase family protein [Sandaracinaceae bacterium]|nr:alkaline phosphatase family protein [Sandaracinaceae bacterium]